MYVAQDRPRFVVTAQVIDGSQCFLTWNFEFYFRRRGPQQLQTIRGASHISFNEAGLVARARENATHNALDNVQFHAADLAQDLSGHAWMKAGFDRLLLDPPRSGARLLAEQRAAAEKRAATEKR